MARRGGQLAYMVKMKDRKNGSINVEPVTVATIEGITYHIALGGDIEIPEMDEAIYENGMIYVYSLRKSRAIEIMNSIKDEMAAHIIVEKE